MLYHVFMSWKLPVIILGSAGVVGALAYALRPRHSLVIYSSDPLDPSAERGEFLRNAQIAARALGTRPIPVSSAAQLIRATQRAPNNLGRVIFIGHGTTTRFLSPRRYGIRLSGGTSLPAWISANDYARILAPKLARNFFIGLGGCSAARSPSEPSGWTPATGWRGGADSLAGRLRDALTVNGAPSGIVGGHSVLGTTLDNPQGREFRTGRQYVGRPGIHIMELAGRPGPPDFESYRAWNNYAQGRIAANWMLGGGIRRG